MISPPLTSFVPSPLYNHSPLRVKSSRARHRCCSDRSAASGEKNIDIASVGNLCLDINLPITGYSVQKGEHQLLRNVARLELGGSLNALISAKRFGAQVAPIAYIADNTAHPSDVFISDYVYASCQRLGMCTDGLIARQGSFVQTCAALFDQAGQHTFLSSNELPPLKPESHQPCAGEGMLGTVARSKILIVDGYAIHSDRQLVSEAVQAALNSKTHLWVDPQSASSSLLNTEDDLFRHVMETATGVAVTADEAFTLTGHRGPSAVVEFLRYELCPSASTFLIKDGAHGSHVASKRSDGSFECTVAPPVPIGTEVRDTIGAGDAFLGAFLAGGLSLELSTKESALLANAMGACTCLSHGAGDSGVGTLKHVRELLHNTPILEKLPVEQLKV